MQIRLIIILTLFTSVVMFAQNKNALNQKDSLGNRIGYWEYKKDYLCLSARLPI